MNYTVEIVREVEHIKNIRSIWQEWQFHPCSTVEAYLASLQNYSSDVTPCLILILANGAPQTLAIAKILETNLEFKIGYYKVYESRARVISVIDRGILGNQSYENARHMVKVIVQLLKQEEADMAHFASIPIESQVYKAAREISNPFCRGHFVPPEERWAIGLGDDYPSFLQQFSYNTRRKIIQSQKRLEHTFKQRMLTRCITKPEEIDSALDAVEIVAAKTYQRGIGTGYKNTEQERNFINSMARHGMCSIYLISIDEKPVAFWFGFFFREVYYCAATGYDPDFSKYRVGAYLLFRMIESLCNSSSIKLIDFGLGDAEYKKIYSNNLSLESHVRIFSPTPTGIKLNAVRSLTFFISRVASYALKKFNFYSEAKRLARKRLSRPE